MTDKDKIMFESEYDCPFCMEEGFGSAGIKQHILRECNVFRKISPEQDFSLRLPNDEQQAAKESSSKELEAEQEAHAATIQREAKLSLELEAAQRANIKLIEDNNSLRETARLGADKLEAAKQRIAIDAAVKALEDARDKFNGNTAFNFMYPEHAASGAYSDASGELDVMAEELRTALPRDVERDSLVGMQELRIEALEKKLAEQQAVMYELPRKIADSCFGTSPSMFRTTTYETAHLCVVRCDKDHQDEEGYSIFSGGTEELTKLLAEARKEGFEEGCKFTVEKECPSYYEAGKQAGRDEVLKELSEQEPLFYYRDGEDKAHRGAYMQGFTIALIPRPLPPIVKEK
jgi:hypothetical protein